MDTTESAPEWEFFERIEKLEALKPTAEDARILAVASFELAFTASVFHNPRIARRLKDSLVAAFKQFGLSPGLLEVLEQDLLGICDHVEKGKK